MSRRRLLAVARARRVLALIRGAAARHNFVVTEVDAPATVLAELAVTLPPDVLMIEDGRGFEGVPLVKRLRRDGLDALMMLIVSGGEKATLSALRAGADDVVQVDTSPEEVHARLGVMVRRLGMVTGVQRLLPQLAFDRERLVVSSGRREIQLTATEFQILHVLARKSGRTLNRDYLVSQIWHTQSPVRTRSVDMHVSHLRHKLADFPIRIVTVRPSGYRLEPKSH